METNTMTAAIAAPWPDGAPVDLSAMLDAVVAALQRFVHFASEHQALAVTLWIAHTHMIESFDVSPRLAIRAPSKQSGKTRLMEVVRELVRNGWHVVGPSAPVLFRSIEKRLPTILLDEADRLFERRAEDTADVLQLLNTGHARGSTVPRVVGPKHELHDFPAFAAVALAGIGTDWPDTILDRSIVINMERKTSNEPVERLRRDAKEALRAIGDELAASLGAVQTFTVEPDRLPQELPDRAQDGWEPLLAIADAAGPVWARRARDAAVALADAGVLGADEREELILLRDMRAIFEAEGDPDFLPSSTLLPRLLTMKESPWLDGGPRPFNVYRMSRLMAVFGVKPHQRVRGGPRGYFLADIERHWGRLGTPGESLAHLVPAVTASAEGADDEAA